RCASVMGRLFQRRVLEHVLSSPVSGRRPADGGAAARAVDGALAVLADEALIYEERVVPEEEYSFKHVLTQETIYQSIPAPPRQRLHQRVAAALEAIYRDELEGHYEQLAHHYERSTAHDKAIEYLLKAGEKAKRTFS